MGSSIELEYLFKDRVSGDVEARPHNLCKILDGPNGRIFSTCLMAGGKGLHPLVVFCHGYPGNEENMDVAHSLQRVGFHVMTFHYSGSWGSGGMFSLQHCIEDTHFIIDTMKARPEYQCDAGSIFLFGQSMGGFVVSHVIAARDDIQAVVAAVPADFGEMERRSHTSEKAREAFRLGLEEGDGWLAGTSLDLMEWECRSFSAGRRFVDLVDRQNLPMLILGTEYDTLVPPKTFIEPWAQQLRERYGEKIEYSCLPTDHMLSDMRCRLTELTAEFYVKWMQ